MIELCLPSCAAFIRLALTKPPRPKPNARREKNNTAGVCWTKTMVSRNLDAICETRTTSAKYSELEVMQASELIFFSFHFGSCSSSPRSSVRQLVEESAMQISDEISSTLICCSNQIGQKILVKARGFRYCNFPVLKSNTVLFTSTNKRSPS